MALITKLTPKKRQGAAEHSKTEATYFFTEEGLLQIDTYGSKDRKSEQKVSQSVQFSPEMMKQLFEIWTEHLVRGGEKFRQEK